MDIHTFMTNYREAFGERAELPIAFWYSDKQESETEKIGGCFFKGLQQVREGKTISLNSDVIGCGGGKFYTGFTEMPIHEQIQVPRTEKAYLHFARIDKLASFDDVEGLLFLATPDILSGLTTWAFYDTNAFDTVAAPFGSGCSSVITLTVLENQKDGRRCFLGFFDPSVRPHFEANLLSFTIPMSRFKEMYHTMRESCLFDTHAWGKIKERINE